MSCNVRMVCVGGSGPGELHHCGVRGWSVDYGDLRSGGNGTSGFFVLVVSASCCLHQRYYKH